MYDTIGRDYARLRRPDARIARRIHDALGPARTVLNVGAGAGSYEPADRQVTALEPSVEMIRQRPATSATVVQGHAEDLPFEDRSFDASMAILTIHHWADRERGLREMRRVTRGPIVILTHDPAADWFWLTEYLPELRDLDRGKMPTLAELARWLGPLAVSPVPVPHDCTDGFRSAYWRRPAAYLDPKVRAAMSSFWVLGNVSGPLLALREDLDSGAWARRNAGLLDLDALDCGYRLVIGG